MTFDLVYPRYAAICAVLAAIAIALLWRRRRQLGKPAAALLSLACLLAAGAGGLPRMAIRGDAQVQVLLDMSASTRTADYRDEAHLTARLRELIPSQRYHISTFGENQPSTVLPPITEPTLLFSDGQFTYSSAAAPVFAVIDQNLDKAHDARIERLVHERGRTIAIVANSGPPRTMSANGAVFSIPTGRYRVDVGSAFASAKVSLNAGDDWPENDAMELPAAPPLGLNRWCIGLNPPVGFERISHADLPADASSYLSTSLLITDAGDAARLDTAQQAAIVTWVRDLGGSLLVVGTDAAWSNLRGTQIEAISPLSVDPPEPRTEWVILIDTSGSMAQVEVGHSQWQRAVEAAAAAIRTLPANDYVRLGSFAADVRWWQLAPARQIAANPPAGLAPHGPTNFDAAIRQILALPASAGRQVLLLTDAEVELPAAGTIADDLRARGASISCVALSDGRGIAILRQLAAATGGRVVSESDPNAWPSAARALASQLAPTRWHSTPLPIRLTAPFATQDVIAQGWNSAWPRERARVFARGKPQPDEVDLGATWQIGLGQSAAVSWPISTDEIAQLASALEHPPSDDRYHIDWPDEKPLIRVHGTATAVSLHTTHGNQIQVAQLAPTAPGLFELNWSPPPEGTQAAILADRRVIAAQIFPARYAHEFDAIGINRATLQRLASETGGKLVEPEDRIPIPLRFAPYFVSLAPWLGLGCLALSATSVLLLRRRI